jgi:hypothetical protein
LIRPNARHSHIFPSSAGFDINSPGAQASA